MSVATILGYFAGFLTTVSFVPQVLKTWKTKSVGDLSLGMFLVFFVGVACWMVYGMLLNESPLIIANFVTLILAGAILVMKLKFKNKNEKKPEQVLQKKPEIKVFQDWGI